MLSAEIFGTLVPDRPALRGLRELVLGQRPGHLDQTGIAIHSFGAGLSGRLGQAGGVREADVSFGDPGPGSRHLPDLGLGAHVAGCVGTRPTADLIQQPSAAVAVPLAACDDRCRLRLEQLRLRTQPLRQPERFSQFSSRRVLDFIEGGSEQVESLAHWYGHTFILSAWFTIPTTRNRTNVAVT
ncbi:MAG: hypothetical protein OXF61_09125 [Acidimicrobiaceae bacterium]|nr:hypothetical protein [Acidimicrobiaceae bacterium]